MNTFLILTATLAMQSTEAPDTTAFSRELDELVIVAKKEVIKSDGASLTYDLSEDNSTNGLTLMEALRKVPMVTIDGEDKIKINGDSNFKIYVNGKEDPMLESNYDKIFKSMPADAVMKVEVITEPGAKYDAEGTGGILNLITLTSQRKDGYSGSASASLSNREYYFSLMGRMKYHNFSADANVTFGSNSFCDQIQDQVYTTINKESDNQYCQQTEQRQRFGYTFTQAALNAAWEPNESNLFTMGASFMDLNAKVKGIDSQTIMFSKGGEIVWENAQNIHGRLKNLSSTANASYQHNFGDKSHFLVASWLYSFGKNPIDFISHITDIENYPLTLPWTRNYNTNYNREHTFQFDYTNPFEGDKHKLETGVKAILRHNSGIGNNGTGTVEESIIPQKGSDVNLTQLQDVYAIYGTYTGTFNKVSTTAGIRFEHTRMEMRNNLDRSKDFTRRLNDVVPNAAVTYLFSPASNLRLSYQMRITRPSLNQMSPYQMDILGSLVQEGNPDLKSERSNNITLKYTNFSRLLGGNVYLDYKHINNAIENYYYFTSKDDGEIVTHQTSANIGNRHEFGLGGFCNIYITNQMNVSVNGRVAYVKLFSPSPFYKNHGWTGNYGVNWSWTGPWNLNFSAYGGQSFKTIQLQGYYSGWYYYGIGISRNFLKEALNVSLTSSNFLQESIVFKSLTQAGPQTTTINNKSYTWKVGISLTWNFGSLNSQTKKTDIQIENNDISTSGAKRGVGI